MLAGIWRVAWFEYARIVFRKQFLLVLLSPVLIILVLGIVMFILVLSLFSDKPIGYVDLTGKIQPPENFADSVLYISTEEILAFPDEASGRDALEEKDINALYVVEEDYFSTGQVRLVAMEYPEEEAETDMKAFLRANLVSAYPTEIADRLLIGSIVQAEHSGSEDASSFANVGGTFFWKMFIPMLFSILFTVIIGVTSGYMLNAVLDEKADRTVEILLTSVKPIQLMIGKITGNLAIGLTQLLLWGGLPLVAVVIGAAFLPNFVDMGFDANLMWISAGLVVLGVIQFSALLTILGSLVVEDREAQQVSGLVSLGYMMPYFFLSKLMFEPTGTISTVLSLFPLTAPLSMPFRIAFSDVPTVQIVMTFAFSLLATAGLLWLAGVAFHRGIMQYDKRVRLKELFSTKEGSNA